MTIHHHIDDATLMSYAAGTLSEPLSAVVSCHIDLCKDCQDSLKSFNMLGGVLLEIIPTDDISSPAQQPPVLKDITTQDDEEKFSEKTVQKNSIVPASLQKIIGTDLEHLHWRTMAPGIKFYELPLSHKGAGYLRLMKFAPATVLPEHGHNGTELTLVLEGGYSDGYGHYLPGDVADLDEAVRHRPVIDRDGECISLVAADAPANYSSLIPRLLQPLTGM